MFVKDKQGGSTEVGKRIATEDIYQLLNSRPVSRQDYLRAYEAGYNFGPGRFPPQVYIELTSECNLKCVFCHHPDMKRDNEDMDADMARRVIDECAENGVWYLTFQNYGEPLLTADLVTEMIAYAKSKGIPVVNVTSNMTIMTEKIMRAWTAAGLDSLNISFEGASAEKYKQVRGAKHSKVMKNIKMAHRVREEMGLGTPFLSLTMVRTDETLEQIERFETVVSPYVDSIDIRAMLVFNYRAEDTKEYEDNAPDWYLTRREEMRIPCRQIGSKLIVTAQGDVTACCTDIDADLSFGNVRDKSLKDMWHSDEMARLYMVHRQQRWDELPEVCKACKDWDWQGEMSDLKSKDKRWADSEAELETIDPAKVAAE